MRTPVIAGGLFQQFLFIGRQFRIKGRAAFKGVLPQHAVAPTVDGVDGGLIHPKGGPFKNSGLLNPQFLRKRMPQGVHKLIFAFFPTKKCGGFNQFIANPIPQFLRSGIGEGDHQDFRGHEGSREPILSAMPQHQS